MGWLSQFYATLLYVSDIGANSFAQFQLGVLNSEKDKYLKKTKQKKTLFETNMKLCNVRFEKIKILEGVASRKNVIAKDFYLKF